MTDFDTIRSKKQFEFVLSLKHMTQLLFSTILSLSALTSIIADTKNLDAELKSDGPDQGLTAYELIRNFAGPRPIESPDLYPQNHPDVRHIIERTDEVVGHHFVFKIHRDLDKDRDKYIKFGDRQRNEIKAYASSRNELKGFEGETLSYEWKFKVGEGMSVSKNFTHLFQLKSVDDGIGTPILTISAAHRGGGENMFLAHSAVKKAQYLRVVPWRKTHNKWLKVKCTVTYANEGKLSIEVVELVSGKEVFNFEADNIDMWRGTKDSHFVRPKWGIYRSLKSKHMLREEEEEVSFADFKVTKHIN